MNITKITLITLAALAATGCANIHVPAPQPTLANVNSAKQLPTSANVGTFKAAASLNQGADQSISIRGSNTLKAPEGQTFSTHLRDVLLTDLRAAGKFDSGAPLLITGELTKSELEAGMAVGTATLGARFLVTRANTVCLDKELVATSQWESSFVGAVAIPLAFNQYAALYPELAGKLLQDTDFREQCAKAP